MSNFDFTSSLLSLRSRITMPCMSLTLVLLVLGFFWEGFFWGAVCIFAFTLFINSLYVIMPGFAGYKITFGQLANQSFPAGWGFMIPFISSMTEVNIKKETHKDRNTMKNVNRREIVLEYTLTWFLNPKEVHTLHRTLGETKDGDRGYVKTSLCPQLDYAFTQVISTMTYEDINGKLDTVAREVMVIFNDLINHDIFHDVELNITDVKFDTAYEEAVSKLAEATMKIDIAKKERERKEIDATGEANATKIKGDAENEIKERLGKILKENPELIKEVLAKNFPKVFGSNVSPMISLEEMLGGK